MEQRTVRRAVMEDLPEIMTVYRLAQDYMIAHGNETQWGRAYPTREIIAADIAMEGCHVILGKDGAIHGVFFAAPGPEPEYAVIDGAWHSHRPYHVIHRVASDGQLRNVVGTAVAWAGKQSDHLRIDTHADNRPMQRALERNGFRRCGVITREDGTTRWGYDRIPEQESL